MASNFFGDIFKITTFGESHGVGIGVVIDGCPAGISISKEEIDQELFFRSPGKSFYTSPRSEEDQCQILSGFFDGKTTGAPIALFIPNKDAKPDQYDSIKNLYRPGHANFTYLEKYQIFDYRGGGRSSGRETAARVAAGAIAKKILKQANIQCVAFLSQVGEISCNYSSDSIEEIKEKARNSPIFCPDGETENKMIKKIEEIKKERDSIGGIVSCKAILPPGLGDPIYAKLEALLAFAMLSIPASKGFEIGCGFESARMKGSEHNDAFSLNEQKNISIETNHAGGTLGGISTGSPLIFRVGFKPTSSIKKDQTTVSLDKKKTTLNLPESARHDPCIAIRAVPVVEAMCALVLVDRLLANRTARF